MQWLQALCQRVGLPGHVYGKEKSRDYTGIMLRLFPVRAGLSLWRY